MKCVCRVDLVFDLIVPYHSIVRRNVEPVTVLIKDVGNEEVARGIVLH